MYSNLSYSLKNLLPSLCTPPTYFYKQILSVLFCDSFFLSKIFAPSIYKITHFFPSLSFLYSYHLS